MNLRERLTHKTVLISIANASLRLFSLFFRFSLSIYLGKFLGLKDVGVFGLLLGITGSLPAIIGLGLNYFVNRETVGSEPLVAGRKIKDRLAVTISGLLLSTLLIIPILINSNISDVSIIVPTVLVIIAECVAFDVQMSLFSLKKPLLANFFLFIRSASWVLPFIVLSRFDLHFRNISCLIISWLIADVAAFSMLFWRLSDWPWASIFASQIDFSWLRKSIKSARLIYLGDIGLAGYAYFDRFIVLGFVGLQSEGIYVFWWSMASALQALVASAVIQTSLPLLVEARKSPDRSKWRNLLRNTIGATLAYAIIGAVLIYVASMIMLPFIKRPLLYDYIDVLIAMLIASVIKSVSDVINYGLYSCGDDNKLAYINIFGLVVSVTTISLALAIGGLHLVGYALFTSASISLFLRTFFLRRHFGAR